MTHPDNPDRSKSRRKKTRPFTWRFLTIIFALIALLMTGIFGVGILCGVRWSATLAPATTAAVPSEGMPLKPGPWGELYYVPLTIAPPDKILPVHALEAAGTHWFFKHFSREDLAAFLQSSKVPASLCDALLDPEVLHVQPDGIDLTPSFDSLFSLPSDSRTAIYKCLARFPENNSQFFYFETASLEGRFAGSGVSQETIGLFTRLSANQGDYVAFSGLPSLLAHLQASDEKVRLLKALAQQETMLLRLRVRSTSDIDALAKYWGKGRYATDVHTMLGSIAQETDWTWFDILNVLPPLPSSPSYSYPVIPDTTPPAAPPVNHDSRWTAFNFFNEAPGNDFTNPDVIAQQLKTNYDPVSGNPVYGDLVLFSAPDGSLVHPAVYMADNIVFTRNGDTLVDPCMLSTIDDLAGRYSFQLPPDKKLTISYFRGKSP